MTEPVIIGNATRIYALCEPWDADCPRYIGKTIQSLRLRRAAHVLAAERGGKLPVHYWLRKRGGAIIRWIETVPPDGDWAERERYWIAAARRNGHNILNLTDGGEGFPGLVRTKQHRERVAEALRTGDHFACEMCGVSFWRKRNEIDKGNNRFCSRQCYQDSLRGKHKKMDEAVRCKGVRAAAEKQRAKTHCPQGHTYSGENLYINPKGRRVCRACALEAKRRYRKRGGHG